MIELDTFKKLMVENNDRLPLLTLDEFFEGNTAEDSIAPNDCDFGRPSIAEIWELMRNLEKRPDIAWIRIELHNDTEIAEYDGNEVLGDTVENIFQLHYGVTKCSSNDLFKQLIEYGSVATLNEFCEGQLMPQIFSQGKTKAILCKPTKNKIVILFLESELNAKENYTKAIDLDLKVKTLFE